MNYKIDGFHIYEYCASNKPDAVLFFAHANAIPAFTYANLWSNVAKTLNINVICYDMRGIGKTICPPVYDDQNWGWNVLVNDHVNLFNKIKKTYPKDTKFILSGHSVGAWIALLSTQFLGVYPLLLCDPPLLHTKEAVGYFLLHLRKKRHENLKSKKALKRRRMFNSEQSAYEFFKQTPFLSKFNKEDLMNYIVGAFHAGSKTKQIFLSHDPKWEAHIFAQYPPISFQGFMKINKKIRHELKPIFLVGSLSDTCNSKGKRLVKYFFPSLEWVVLANAGHMFPIENQDLMITALERVFQTNSFLLKNLL